MSGKIDDLMPSAKELQKQASIKEVCTDRGRANNQEEPGWQRTLTGIPLKIFQLWSDYPKPRCHRIRYRLAGFSDGMHGDICIANVWGD